jgi:carbamoylphosphate synthase large subunit
MTHFAITGKYPLLPPFRERGDFWPAWLTDDERDREGPLTSEALRALGITTGVAHTEIKLTPDGPRIIEVNELSRFDP